MIEKAIQFAVSAHAGTKRKGKDRAYILHPVEVMTIVASLTEDEEVIAAAVLHDVVEDTEIGPDAIREEFGERVAQLVMAESEDKMRDIPAEASWRERKMATIDHLETLSRDAKLICLGDKLANIREIARDYDLIGDALWQRFNQKDKNEHGWYYRMICIELQKEFGDIPPIQEYRDHLAHIFGQSKVDAEQEPEDSRPGGNSEYAQEFDRVLLEYTDSPDSDGLYDVLSLLFEGIRKNYSLPCPAEIDPENGGFSPMFLKKKNGEEHLAVLTGDSDERFPVIAKVKLRYLAYLVFDVEECEGIIFNPMQRNAFFVPKAFLGSALSAGYEMITNVSIATFWKDYRKSPAR